MHILKCLVFPRFVQGGVMVFLFSSQGNVFFYQGNVRDVDGLNDPRLKHFVYWYGLISIVVFLFSEYHGLVWCGSGLNVAAAEDQHH
mgnify:CR=1 FL=1